MWFGWVGCNGCIKIKQSDFPLLAVAVADRALVGLVAAEPAVEDRPVAPAVHHHRLLVQLPVLEGAGELVAVLVGERA